MNQALQARRFGVKIYLDGTAAPLDLGAQIGVFQRWIQQDALDELLIDAADYRHVPQGPGVLLVCHAAHYALDASDGALGLSFEAKRDEPDTLAARFKRAFVSTLRAASRLEQDSGSRFDTSSLRFRVQDRLLAPNEPETFKTLQPALQQLALALYGDTAELRPQANDPRQPFTVRLASTASTKPTLPQLLERAELLP